MASKLVAVVDAKSSKADEVAALRKMAECATEGSYLAMLLTPQLLDWVKGQIEMDMPPDIMESRTFQVEKRIEVEVELARVRQELADADRKAGWAAKKIAERHQRELEKMRDRAVCAEARQVRYWQAWETARAKSDAYRDSLLWAWGWVGWLMAKRDEAERLIEQTKVRAFAMLAKVLLDKPQEESE